MKDHEMRIRIPATLFKRYKLICVQMDLSMPKQTAEIIRKFVEVQEDNQEKLRSLKGKYEKSKSTIII